ncbi:hypothetical protein ACH5RR_020986 [Cinchona calisaya]|uniref:Uncharacterized protein n=1 Tax=Cinchona calisaya TaxID=153742 RepID=A0ABD2ZG14_9GENT
MQTRCQMNTQRIRSPPKRTTCKEEPVNSMPRIGPNTPNIKESKGFDVDRYPGDSLSATFLPRTMFLRCPQFKNRMMKMAQEALKYFNDGHNYEAVDVEKAFGTTALFYVITFKAKKLHAASNANADDDE